VGARSLMQDQPMGHARHHLRVYDLTQALPLKPLDTAQSVRTADRPIVPTQYGGYDYEVFTGAGGFSASALQVARLLAGLTIRDGNPAYSADTLQKWIDAAVAAGAAHPGGCGFHGFDGVKYIDAANAVWRGSKGGWMVSHESSASVAIDGYGVVLLNNGNLDPKANFDWATQLGGAFGFDAGKWGGVDHWNAFGMQPFVAMKSKKFGPTKLQPPKVDALKRQPFKLQPQPRWGGFGLAPGEAKRWADLHRKTFTEQALRKPGRRPPVRR
jgi:hypothetical protein